MSQQQKWLLKEAVPKPAQALDSPLGKDRQMTHILTPIMAARPVTVSTVWRWRQPPPPSRATSRSGSERHWRVPGDAAGAANMRPWGPSMLQVHKGSSRRDGCTGLNRGESLNHSKHAVNAAFSRLMPGASGTGRLSLRVSLSPKINTVSRRVGKNPDIARLRIRDRGANSQATLKE